MVLKSKGAQNTVQVQKLALVGIVPEPHDFPFFFSVFFSVLPFLSVTSEKV